MSTRFLVTGEQIAALEDSPSGGILRSFLTAVQTDAGLPAVTEVEIRNPFNLAVSSDRKRLVVDVRARDVEGTVYTIEVQALHLSPCPAGDGDADSHTASGGPLSGTAQVARELYQDRIKAERDRRSQLIYARMRR